MFTCIAVACRGLPERVAWAVPLTREKLVNFAGCCCFLTGSLAPVLQLPGAGFAEELGREYPRRVAQHLGGPRPGVSQVLAAERQLGQHRRERSVGTGDFLPDLAEDVQLDSHAGLGSDLRERELSQPAG